MSAPQISCTAFCDTINMRPLSLYDDNLKGEDDRQKTQGGGSRNKSNNVRKNKKNSAIVRVCQLRMIVWLVDPPLVSSAGRLPAYRGILRP